MTDHPDRWQRVAEAVAARMREVGYLDNASLQRAADLSEPFVRYLLAGQPRGTPRQSSLVKLCRALGWSDDSVDRLLAGGDVAATEVSRPADDPSAPLQAQVAVLVMQQTRRLAEQVEAQGDEIARLRARLDRLRPEEGEALP